MTEVRFAALKAMSGPGGEKPTNAGQRVAVEAVAAPLAIISAYDIENADSVLYG